MMRPTPTATPRTSPKKNDIAATRNNHSRVKPSSKEVMVGSFWRSLNHGGGEKRRSRRRRRGKGEILRKELGDGDEI